MGATADDVKNAVDKPQQPPDNPWPDRLKAWKTFSEKFHTRGDSIEKRYEDDRDSSNNATTDMPGIKKVNTFYSNTTVIKESLYNSLPKPSVSRMHQGDFENEPARVAATIIERGLSYEVRCAHWFDPAVKSAILDRLVPGLGILWVTFSQPKMEGKKQIPEAISVETVYWKDFLYEPKRVWEQVTWAGRKLHVDPKEAKRRWGPTAITGDSTFKNGSPNTVEQAITQGKVCVIEMWDKSTRQVHYMTPQGTILSTINDPYDLLNFFPFPKPLIASPPTSRFLPLPDYYMAQDQYMEMDILYARINLIIEAVRVAGVYDSSVPEIGRMLSGAENKLIPVDNWAMFAEKGGTKGVIDWFPVEQVTSVLQQLTSTYTFIKTELYEVTGMSDIVRGSSNQYETLGAQQIKAQFASVRLNGFQRDVSFFVRDTLRIMAELMCQLYSDQKMLAIIGTLPAGDEQFLQPAAEIIRNDFMLKYNVDIEADSLTQADWGLEQQQRMAYAQSLSQFLTSALPVAQQVPELGQLMVQIIKFMSVGFKGSSELESTLDSVLATLSNAPPQQDEGPSPEEMKMEADLQLISAKTEAVKQEAGIKARERMEELRFKQDAHIQDLQFQQEKHVQQLQFNREKNEQQLALENARLAAKTAMDDHRLRNAEERADIKLAGEIHRESQKSDKED